MAVKSSAEVIRQMQASIRNTIKQIETINQHINSGLNTGEWQDSKSAEYVGLMKNVASLTSSPLDTLQAALPKLEKLAQALDNYNSVRIG